MANEDKRPIVIKRIKKVTGGAHGGAWKIAYADFVTAMMAFFLLMWLLGSTSKGDLNGIAEYFKTPLKVALAGGSGSGDSSSIIKGGGQDLTRSEGQVKSGELPPEKKIINLKAARAEFLRQERIRELEKLKALKAALEKVIEADAKLKKFKNQILLDLTSEGLRVQIVDEKNRPMFQSGSAELEPYTKDILREIGKMLNDMPNKVSLSGHTDAQPYVTADGRYSNWELSADRGNASRREMIKGGLAEGKIVRVVGLSSAVLFDSAQPLNPINRRISIIVMNKRAEEAALKDGGSVDIDAETGDPIEEKEPDEAPSVGMADAAPAGAATGVSPGAPPAAN
ncbi:MAG: flagellar motor protein MotB [Sideroxyarcus sp.]|nr:flagellar motor protein MotB [Sideroxyarcus sp.]